MVWRIEFDPAADKELSALDPQNARRIIQFLRKRVAKLDDPRQLGEALHGPRLGAFWKYRIGDFRIIASLEDQVLLILVLRVGHRREIYRRERR
jgi:mRNA interferase RelE/StbE